jgi:hypothetical protein
MTISPGKGVGGVVAGRQPEVGDPPPARLSRHLLGSIFVFLLGPGAVTYLKINNQIYKKTKNTAGRGNSSGFLAPQTHTHVTVGRSLSMQCR